MPRFDALRLALRNAIGPLLPSKSGARACARVLDLDKSLGWKLYQMAFSDDAASSLSSVPGARGWEIVLDRLPRAGANAAAVAAVREAIFGFEQQLVEKRLDRKMLAGMVAAGRRADDATKARQMMRVRKEASDATALLWGVQAYARVDTFVVAPSKSGGTIDLVAVTSFDRLERRRQGAPWPIFAACSCPWSGERLALAPLAAGEMLLAGISSPEAARSGLTRDGDNDDSRYCFVGNAGGAEGPIRASFGGVSRNTAPKSRWQGAARFASTAMIPAATSALEVCIHRSLVDGRPGSASLHAAIPCVPGDSDGTALALDAGVERFDGERPSIAGLDDEFNRAHADAVGAALASCSASLGDFEIRRVVVAYAPAPSRLAIVI